MRMKSTHKNEMYMANAQILRLVPTATYIQPTCVGAFALGVTQILAFLDTNMLLNPLKKFTLGYYPTQIPNARSSALQWNIGFSFSDLIKSE